MTTYTENEKKGLIASMELLAMQAVIQKNTVIEQIIRDVIHNINNDIYDADTLDIVIQFLAQGREESDETDSIGLTYLHRKTVKMYLERYSY